ncbi:MAG: SGNH/GDSL hydrolase family protein [Nocardioides sp.]|nr:SGNH/GDSL hydrolase family protein [Nocardioides sp.]
MDRSPYRALVALLTVGLLVLAACSSGAEPPEGSARVAIDRAPDAAPSADELPEFDRYVALGDSYTAAPYVPQTDLADGCLRSDSNYPAILASRLAIGTLVDVSCSAASTNDLTEAQRVYEDNTVHPQLDAVTPETDLVTVGLGGNDEDLFLTLVGTCTSVSGDLSGSPCTDRLAQRGVDLDASIAQVEENLVSALEAVQERAPDATVVLVGYPHIVPLRGGCEQLPLAEGDLDLARELTAGLDRAMAAAAQDAGVLFAATRPATRGHDICGDEPWVNGAFRDRSRGLEYHPFAEGQQAVADVVTQVLSENA